MEKQKYKIENYDDSSLLAENKKLSKEYKRQVKFTILSVFFVTIIMISSAYAIFSDVTRQQSDNTLTVGKLKIDFIDTESGMGNIINLNGAYPVSDTVGNDTSPYIFKITNSGTLDAKYFVKIVDDQEVIAEDGCGSNLLPKDKIRVSVNKGEPFTLSDTAINNYIIDQGDLLRNASKTYEIRIWISDQSGNEVLGKHYHGKIVVEGENITVNENIIGAYTYDAENDATKCITGEEETCQATKCYDSRTANSCVAGTIIKYKLSDSDTKYFYVISDSGKTMMMLQRENTVNSSSWITNEDYTADAKNDKGPITALAALNTATSTWNNVNPLTYNLNTSTGCTDTSTCSTQTYDLGEQTGKARLITVEELANIGCTGATCPEWVNGGSNYWTSSAYTVQNDSAWSVTNDSYVTTAVVTQNTNGLRAVIQINK